MIRELITKDTQKKTEFYDLTPDVQKIIDVHAIQDGIAIVKTNHTTTAIFLNEKEAGLLYDLEVWMEKMVPRDVYYRHDDFYHRGSDESERVNAVSHLRAILLGSEVTVAIVDGKISLGTWQAIIFAELDGARKERSIEVIIL
ncbi:YjbQ family protein [Candidatus Uhrbacteria bacterium]|nr:YjbQ family protein [Candidatus Uhrbacteria bacterium]